jgi:hypothetical protein
MIEAMMDYAFELGRWAGQVDLEIHMERESYADAAASSIHARKTGMPLHAVASDPHLISRPVRYNLRSQKWRIGVMKTTRDRLEARKNDVRNLLQLFTTDETGNS